MIRHFNCKTRHHSNMGFTLVEVMIAIAIIAILAAVAVPNIISWLPNYRAKAAARDMISNFQRAKMEAVKGNVDVIIQFTPGTYTDAGQVGSYDIFVDDGSGAGGIAGDLIPNGTERIVAQVNMPRNVSLYFTNFTGHTTGYNSRALPWNNRLGSVEIRNNNSRYYKASLSMAGRVRLQKSSDGTWE